MISELRLYAVVLRLGALRPGAIPADHGKQALSALYSLLRIGDEALAQELHDENAHKPFTVSLLDGGRRDREGAQHFGEGDTAEWRFTLLRDPAFEALIQRYVSDRDLPHIRIGAIEFQIADAFVSGSHPRSGYISLERLRQRYTDDNAPKSIMFDFQTPTVFSLGMDKMTQQRRLRAMPVPVTLFSTLRKRWVKLGGTDPGDEFDMWVERTIEAHPLTLRWQSLTIERGQVRGFTGQVRFVHWGEDERWLPFFNMLADLAFYTGVGYQTTRGMGQICRIVEETRR